MGNWVLNIMLAAGAAPLVFMYAGAMTDLAHTALGAARRCPFLVRWRVVNPPHLHREFLEKLEKNERKLREKSVESQ